MKLRFVPLLICVVPPFSVLAQDQPSAKAATDTSKDLPICSTERVNSDCVLNIDRNYPITLPSLTMRRDARMKVVVYHPFAFEALTLDPGNASAYQGTDQGSALLSALIPVAKGQNILGVTTADLSKLNLFSEQFKIQGLDGGTSDYDKAKKIREKIGRLNDKLTQAKKPLSDYLDETALIYARIREAASPVPRPLTEKNQPLRTVDEKNPNPWTEYEEWRIDMQAKIVQQGKDTTTIWELFSTACQKPGPPKDPPPAEGPWLPAARACAGPYNSTQPSPKPPVIPKSFDDSYSTLGDDFTDLGKNHPTPQIWKQLVALRKTLDDRYASIQPFILVAPNLMPTLINKYSADMQSMLAAITVAEPKASTPTVLGWIIGPNNKEPTDPKEKNVLAVYKALAPAITYTVNAQNEIVNSLLTQPAGSQKQGIATISIIFANPRFEGSAGAFLSWLPNRSFTNLTEVAVNNGTPAATDIKINMTKTIPPLVIPFVGANYRIMSEYTWMGKRRGATYLTLGFALNPYNTQVEYVGGLSFSWRSLMFTPMYHLGHSTHLTNGEEVGQTYCRYGGGATATTTPPVCSGNPPAPTTKLYWTGAFAFGISVRVPTVFSSGK